MQETLSDKIITGSMVVLGLAEAAHLAALFLKLSVHSCLNIMAVLFAVVVFGVVFLYINKLKKRKFAKGAGKQPVYDAFLKTFQAYPVLVLLLFLLIVFQVIWNYLLHAPYIAGDITGESVQMLLVSDRLYEINPMTGEPFTAGMPMRLKILVLPTLYAALAKWTGITVPVLVYQIVPGLVLVLSYLVYGRWAAYLFPTDRKKQLWFMLFVALIYQFGAYSTGMDGFALFFRGWQGAAIRAGVILPYALLSGLKEQWLKVCLCLFAEVCVVWTFYGLGYTVVITAVLLLIRLVHGWIAGRAVKR